MKNQECRFFDYGVSVLAAIALYMIGFTVDYEFNLFVPIRSGYNAYDEFAFSGNMIWAVIIVSICLLVHTIMSKATADVVSIYGRRRNCMTKGFFRAAAVSVVLFAVLIIPIFFYSPAGWLTGVIHAFFIPYFGSKKIQEYEEQLYIKRREDLKRRESEAYAAKAGQEKQTSPPAVQEAVISVPESVYCIRCGTKLDGDAVFCRKCGSRVVR